jgi:ribosomal protein S20
MMRALAAVAAASLLTACSSGTSPSDAARTTLRADMTVLAKAAAAADRTAARSALARLQHDLDIAAANGSLSGADVARIRSAMVAVQADLAPTRTPAASTPATSTPPRTKAAPPDHRGKKRGDGSGDD